MQVNTKTSLGFEDLHLYGPPNPAFANILLGVRMQSIVAGYVARVLSHFLAAQAGSPYRDPTRQFRAGGHPPGQMAEQTSASVDVGSAMPGLPADRWTGQITVGVVYAGAAEYGRHAYAQYAGSERLREALYHVLPRL